MRIEQLKRWQWAVLGTALGAIVGYVQSVVGTDPLRAPPRALGQEQFEQELTQKSQGLAKIKDVRVYPDGPLYFVKFNRMEGVKDGRVFTYGQWQFTPPVPYRPGGKARPGAAGNYTILDYLAEVAAKDSAVSYHYVWWETKPMVVAAWTLGGLLLIGWLWPTLVRFLTGAGFGRPAEEPDYDLSRFQSEKDLLPPAPVVDVDADLAAYEASLSKSSEADFPDAPATGAPPAVPQLTPQPVAPAVPAAPDDDKQYEGVFYPVAHGVKKRDPGRG